MKRREEKRREFHEALLRTLYPPPSSPPPPAVDDEQLNVSFFDPEDCLNIGSSDSEDECENGDGDEMDTAEKLSRAQRKRLRKKMLKEEAIRRRKLIGPLLPSTTRRTVGDTHNDSEVSGRDGGGSGEQRVRGNAPENKEKPCGRDKMGKVKKRRVAKKMARGMSEQVHQPLHPPISETQN